MDYISKSEDSPIVLVSIQYNTIDTIYRYCPAFSGVTHLFWTSCYREV